MPLVMRPLNIVALAVAVNFTVEMPNICPKNNPSDPFETLSRRVVTLIVLGNKPMAYEGAEKVAPS